jgi:hypothetical protein
VILSIDTVLAGGNHLVGDLHEQLGYSFVGAEVSSDDVDHLDPIDQSRKLFDDSDGIIAIEGIVRSIFEKFALVKKTQRRFVFKYVFALWTARRGDEAFQTQTIVYRIDKVRDKHIPAKRSMSRGTKLQMIIMSRTVCGTTSFYS